MPKISLWATRLALCYLLIGLTSGAVLLVHKAMPLHPAIRSLLPLHIEFLLMGWVVQLVFAVSYWIFPRFRLDPKRGNPGLAWVSLALLNAGIGLVSMAGYIGQPSWLFKGRVLEVGAVIVFATHLWFRTKATETGMKARKASE